MCRFLKEDMCFNSMCDCYKDLPSTHYCNNCDLRSEYEKEKQTENSEE